MTTNDQPLIFGFDVLADATVTPLTWADLQISAKAPEGGRRWLHFNRLMPETRAWLATKARLAPQVLESLFQEDTRPRATPFQNGILLNLRGVNMNEGENPDNMIAIRIWATKDLIVSVRAFRIRAAEDLAERFRQGHAPANHGELLSFLVERLNFRIDPVVQKLTDDLDALEEKLLDEGRPPMKTQFGVTRRAALAIRRFMSPQREAVSALLHAHTSFFEDDAQSSLRNSYDTLLRLSEDLEAVKDRAQVLQEQITEQRAEEMNQRLFALAIISAVFLPLGFITGLFGVNVGGMPGVDSALAFAILCLFLVGLTGLLFVLFKRIGWM